MKPHNVIYAVTWCAPPWKCNYTCHCRPVCISGYFLIAVVFYICQYENNNFHLNMINNQVFFPLQPVFCRYSWLQLKCMKRRFPQNHFFPPNLSSVPPWTRPKSVKECQRQDCRPAQGCNELQDPSRSSLVRLIRNGRKINLRTR